MFRDNLFSVNAEEYTSKMNIQYQCIYLVYYMNYAFKSRESRTIYTKFISVNSLINNIISKRNISKRNVYIVDDVILHKLN